TRTALSWTAHSKPARTPSSSTASNWKSPSNQWERMGSEDQFLSTRHSVLSTYLECRRKRTMRKIAIPILAISLVLMLAVGSLSAQDAAPEAEGEAMQRDGVSLAIYNQGTALVQDRRTFDFTDGLNTINFTDVAPGIDPTLVSFVSLTDPTGTVVLEQNYVFDLVDSSALLARYLDEQITVIADDGTEYRGQLLSGRNGEVILRQD